MCVCVCVCVRAFVFCFADLPAALVDRPSQVVDASRKRRGKGNDVVFCFVLFSLTEFLLFFFFVSFFLKTNSTPPGDESTERSTSPWVSDLFQVANLKKIKLKNLKKNVFLASESTVHSSLNKKRWVATVPKIAEKKILYIFLLDSKSLEGNSKKTRKSKW